MKKILFLPLLFLMTASFSDLAAQRSRYQGEIQVGFGAGVGSNPFLSLNRVTVDVVNGIRVNSYFSIGLGLGYHTYLGRTIEGIDFTDEHIVPVYANLKGYMPAGRSMFRGFVSLDAGYGFSMESGIGGSRRHWEPASDEMSLFRSAISRKTFLPGDCLCLSVPY